MKFNNRYLFAGLGVCISIIAIFWLANQFDIAELAEALKQLDPIMLAPVLLMILISFCLRAQRWRLLIEHQPKVGYWSSFSAMMIGYFLNNLLPARAGDLARVLELGRTEQISRTKVLATLVTERTVDLVATLAILTVILLSYPALPEWLKSAGITAASLATMALVFLTISHITGHHIVLPLFSFLTRKFPESFSDRLLQMVNSALAGIAGMFRLNRAVGFLFITALLWIIEVGIVYTTAVAVGLPLAPGNALFVLLIIAIGLMVPSSPGFLGTYEFFGVTALSLVGLTGPTSLAFIILLHLQLLFGSTIIGAVCLVLRKGEPVAIKEPARE